MNSKECTRCKGTGRYYKEILIDIKSPGIFTPDGSIPKPSIHCFQVLRNPCDACNGRGIIYEEPIVIKIYSRVSASLLEDLYFNNISLYHWINYHTILQPLMAEDKKNTLYIIVKVYQPNFGVACNKMLTFTKKELTKTKTKWRKISIVINAVEIVTREAIKEVDRFIINRKGGNSDEEL